MADISFFDPRSEKENARRRKQAELLLERGNTPMKNEQAGGMTVLRSPWENINQAAQKFVGERDLASADESDAAMERERQGRIAEALKQWGTDPQAAATILGQDPRTSDMAAKILQGEVDYGRQKERWAQQDALQRELASMRASSGGNTPAAMQIANQMFELEQAMNNPNLSEQERFMAQRQYNLLGQAAKTYGFDRGMQAGAMGGYDSVFGGGNISPVDMLPNGEMVAPQMGGQIPNAPLTPAQYTTMGQNSQFNDLIGGLTGQPMQQDPMAEHAAAVQAQQAQIGVSPMQRPELSMTAPRMGEIPGYGQAAASIAAQKKAAEERAKTLNSPMDATIIKEQNDIVDKINASQGLNANMGKFIEQIDSGQLDLGLMANLENMAKNNFGLSTEQSRNLQSFKATLERLRNESLRLNNGVQTEGDSQRAWNELVANINDPQVVRQRLNEIGELNRIGAKLQNQKLNLMRSEYGRGELEIPNAYQPPQIAVNPQTGERLINRGNGWEPL